MIFRKEYYKNIFLIQFASMQMEHSIFSMHQRWGGTLLLSLTFLQSVFKALSKNSRIARETLFLLIFFGGGVHISSHSSTLKTVTTGFSETSFSMVRTLCYFPFILSHSFIFNLLNWQGTTFGFHGNWIPVAMGRNSCPTNLWLCYRAQWFRRKSTWNSSMMDVIW